MIPQVWRAYWQQQQKSKKYEPEPDKPVGNWYAVGKVWLCDCFVNLDFLRHGAELDVCHFCGCQRPMD